MNRAIALCVLLGLSSQAPAAFIKLDISSLVNSPLTDYFNGGNYPGPGDIVIGGIPFTLYGDSGVASVAGGLASIGTPQVYSLSGLNIGGATTMYAILGSAFGDCSSTVGSISATTSSGTDTFQIVEGVNVRDHYFGADSPYCLDATDLFATASYPGTVRLEVYRFDITSATGNGAFAVTDFEFQTFGQDLLGEPFLAAVTFADRDAAPIPEPSGLTMIAVGLGAVIFGSRRRR